MRSLSRRWLVERVRKLTAEIAEMKAREAGLHIENLALRARVQDLADPQGRAAERGTAVDADVEADL